MDQNQSIKLGSNGLLVLYIDQDPITHLHKRGYLLSLMDPKYSLIIYINDLVID